MLSKLRNPAGAADGPEQADEAAPEVRELAPLRMLAAPLLLLTGVEATLEARARGDATPAADRASLAAAWAPSLLAPMAAAAQLAHLSRPSEAVSAASRVLNAAVVGAGAAAVADMLLAYREGRRAPSLAPLALAASGLLAMLLDRQAERIEAERERLERRARIVERLVPRRRPRVDRIVVHV